MRRIVRVRSTKASSTARAQRSVAAQLSSIAGSVTAIKEMISLLGKDLQPDQVRALNKAAGRFSRAVVSAIDTFGGEANDVLG